MESDGVAEQAELRQRNEELELELAASRGEAARLQQQLKHAVEESARQSARGVAALAEVQTLQAERQQVGSDLAETRQRAETAEAQLGAAREKISHIESTQTAAEENSGQWAEAFTQLTARAEALEAQLSARESELAESQAQLAEHAQALAGARDETAQYSAGKAALDQQLTTALASLEEAAGTRAELAAGLENLAAVRGRLETTEADRQSLAGRCAALREEAETLRRDLSGISDGRELLDLRARFKTLDGDHQTARTALDRSVAEAKTLAASEQQLRTDLATTRTRAEAAEHRADAASESALSKDNEVLRGIIARQNAVQEERFAELLRLRRARLGLRILYAFIGLALIGLAAFAIDYLPAAVKSFLHEWFGI